MAGHSHWAGIKHKKALIDNKRGKLWGRLSKAIGDAKAVSMPKDNIERAIKRGTGEIEGGDVEEILYEGYGPGGVAVMCEIMTDNRNRTAPEIRTLFSKYNGNLGSTGCVSYLFDRKGLFVLATGTDEERAVEIAMENGGDNVETNDQGKLEITCSPEAFGGLADALAQAGIACEFSEVTRIAQTEVELDPETARGALKLLEMLDDHDDVQSVSTNLRLSPELMAQLQE